MTGTPNRTLAESLKGNIDLENDTLRVALFDNSVAYSFDPDAHDFVNDILDGGTTAQELQGSTGYTGQSDRKTIANVSVTVDDGNDRGVFDGDDVTWIDVASAEDIQGVIIYKQVGGDDSTPGDDPIIEVIDDSMGDAPSSLPLPTNGSDVRVAWDSNGIITISTA
jgi:hypothetical protein